MSSTRQQVLHPSNSSSSFCSSLGFLSCNSATKATTKRKGKEKASTAEPIAAAPTIIYCKKTDGKRWQCKRPAQLPHTLCTYHFNQVRSYASNHSAANNGKNGSQQKKKAGSNFYYYYDGFGPRRGKRRGRPPGSVKKEEGSSAAAATTTTVARRRVEHEDDDDDTVVAGDDEYDIDCFDEGDGDGDGDDDDDDNYTVSGVKISEGVDDGGEKKKRVEVKKKKRGRKPIKARSLKSLL